MFYQTWHHAHNHIQELQQEARRAQQLKTSQALNSNASASSQQLTVDLTIKRLRNAH